MVTILAIIGGGVLFVIIVAIAIFSASNKKRSEKLKNVLEKVKQEGKDLSEQPSNITISKDEPETSAPEKKDKLPSGVIIEDYVDEEEKKAEEPIIEDYSDLNIFDLENKKESKEEKINWDDFSLFDDDEDDEDRPKKKKKKKPSKQKSGDDFEEFLNEHTYTRKILDKDLLKKLNSYPPEVRNAILNNVLNKYD